MKKYHEMMLRYSFLLHKKADSFASLEYLRSAENDRVKRAKNYCWYFGSKNKLNWLMIRSLICAKRLFADRLVLTLNSDMKAIDS
jgi:hypothetical protein